MSMSKRLCLGMLSVLVVCGTVGVLTPLDNQAEAVGIFDKFQKGKCDVPPTWGEIIYGKKRWVKKMGGAAYCDRQTGLVLEQSPSPETFTWDSARFRCANLTVGGNGQKGWRLPSFAELGSLVDINSKQCADGGPCLPNGNPFSDNVESADYWSATTNAIFPSFAWNVRFGSGGVGANNKDFTKHAWCVRGAMSASMY